MSSYKRITEVFDEVEELNPDKSLEWLTQMTVDTLGDIDHSDVIEALFRRSEERKNEQRKT